MGSSNCCKPNKQAEDNFETQFYLPKEDYNTHNEPLENFSQSQIIPEQINDNPTPLPVENGQIKQDPIPVKAQNNIRKPYWNEYPGNIIDLQYDISEEKSSEIFDYLNAIKMMPNDYLEEAKTFGLEKVFQPAISSPSTQTPFISSEGYYYMIRDLLATPSDPQDLSMGIRNHFEEKGLEVEVLLSKSKIANAKEAVWNVLIDNKHSQKQILTLESEYCVVCALPIENTIEMNIYFVLLKKMIY